MPCFLSNPRIKEVLNQYRLTNINQLYEEMLKRYSEEELHQMSEESIIELIKEICKDGSILPWKTLKTKKVSKEVELIYR